MLSEAAAVKQLRDTRAVKTVILMEYVGLFFSKRCSDKIKTSTSILAKGIVYSKLGKM
jgi:hypothetical protein